MENNRQKFVILEQWAAVSSYGEAEKNNVHP
jgi:hypothetical protein